MTARIHLLEDARNPAFRVDQKGRARDPHPLDAEDVLLDPHAVRLRDGVVLVGEERHWQPVFRPELLVRLRAVRAYAEHRCIESLEPREGVSKRARLDGSARGIVLGIEEQNDPSAAEIREGNGTVVMVDGGKTRRWRSSLRQRHPRRSPPISAAMIAFWICSRFSASSQTRLCVPSMTSAATSSPRCAGRQCRKMAPRAACFISAAFTVNPRKARSRCFCSSSWPIDAHTSVLITSAPFAASRGSRVTTTFALPSLRARSSRWSAGSYPSGHAMRSSKPKRYAALIHEFAMLFPSPIHATVSSGIGVFRC